MADLRITGVSNNQLELQAPDGTRHYLEINDDLVKALRNREVTLPATTSPRDIQQMVRQGMTVAEIVSATGADELLVLRFAKPIIAELNHIVSLARNIRLSLAGDRFADPTPVEFGVVMDDRLANNGARNIQWTAKKSPENEWLVSIGFNTSEGAGVATWSFDPKQLFLAPENEAALQLSNGVPVSAVSKTVPIKPELEIEEPTKTSHPATFLTVVPEAIEEIVEEVAAEPEELFIEETATVTTLHIVADEGPEEPVVEESAPITAIVETVAEPQQPAAKPQASSGWAEVLFGSKDEDEEDN